MLIIQFEDNKVCSVLELAARWNTSVQRIYELLIKGHVRAWKSNEPIGSGGVMIEIRSVIELEKSGPWYLLPGLSVSPE